MNLGLIPSLFLIFAVLSIFYSIALSYYFKVRDQQAVRHWSLGSLIWGCAAFIALLRPQLPSLLSYDLSCALAFLAYLEFNRALRSLAGSPAKSVLLRAQDLVVVLAYTLVLSSLDFIGPPAQAEVAKIVMVAGSALVVSLLGARACHQIGRHHRLDIAHHLGYVHVAMAVLWLLRILTAGSGTAPNDLDESSGAKLIWLALFMAGIVKYIVFPMLVLQKAEADNQVQLRSKLFKVNKSLTSGILSAAIAHELNQPLAAIRLNGQVLRQMLDEGEIQGCADLRATIDDILSENERAARIIRSLRAMFKHGGNPVAEVDASQLIRRSVALLARELDRHQIRLELDLADGVRVAIPEEELHQVLLNLMLNSVQALQDPALARERIIALSVRCCGSHAEIRVRDSGPGVEPSIAGALFEVLSSTKPSGMGIGLWLCRYIVERRGGLVSHTNLPAAGALFTVTLPVCARPMSIAKVDA